MIRVQFEGGKELAAAFKSLSTAMTRKVLREGLMEAGEPMRALWARLAPRSDDAPHAADTVTMSAARGRDLQETAVAVGPSKKGFYLSFQELGTEHHAAQPSGRPAFDQSRDKVLATFGKVLWRELAARGVSRPTIAASGPMSGGPGGGTL